MKIQTTKKQMKNNAAQIIAVGYCGAYYLLRDLSPFAYSAGGYGWACDYYDLGNGIILATGYDCSRLGAEYANFDLVQEYNERARKIEGFSDDAKQARADLLAEFIEKITK